MHYHSNVVTFLKFGNILVLFQLWVTLEHEVSRDRERGFSFSLLQFVAWNWMRRVIWQGRRGKQLDCNTKLLFDIIKQTNWKRQLVDTVANFKSPHSHSNFSRAPRIRRKKKRWNGRVNLFAQIKQLKSFQEISVLKSQAHGMNHECKCITENCFQQRIIYLVFQMSHGMNANVFLKMVYCDPIFIQN